MGRRGDRETRPNRTRRYEGRDYDQWGRGEQGYDGRDYRDEGYSGRYGDRYEAERYDRERDRDREHFWREREQRQQTRRTAYLVIGGICIALIALFGIMAVTGNDSSQTAGQAPQQPIPHQPTPQQPAQPQPQAPAAPPAPQQDPASSEQVEGMRADIERQLVEIRQSLNQLRLEIWSFFTGGQQERGSR